MARATLTTAAGDSGARYCVAAVHYAHAVRARSIMTFQSHASRDALADAAALNALLDDHGNTLLSAAARWGQLAVAEWCLNSGIVVDAKNVRVACGARAETTRCVWGGEVSLGRIGGKEVVAAVTGTRLHAVALDQMDGYRLRPLPTRPE